MGIAPVPQYPEKPSYSYQRGLGTEKRYSRGPLRFMEGVATDTDVPADFARGAYADGASIAGIRNRNDPEAQWKHADETTRERAHIGSAAWIEAPSMLSDFAAGAFHGYNEPTYDRVINSGARIRRQEPTVVTD